MRTTIDGAGRIVIPKAVRDAVGLSGGEELEIRAYAGRIEIEVLPSADQTTNPEWPTIGLAREDGPPLTADMVRETLERLREWPRA